MNTFYNKIYWILCSLACIFHIVALVLTYYAIEFLNSYECNSIMSGAFDNIGYIWSGVLSTALIIVMFLILYLLAIVLLNGWRNINIDAIITIVGVTIVLLMVTDMFNDIFAVLHSDLWYYTNFILSIGFKVAGIKSYC